MRFVNKPEEAKNFYKQVLDLDAFNLCAVKGLARALYETGEKADMFRQLQRMEELKNDPQVVEKDLSKESELIYWYG